MLLLLVDDGLKWIASRKHFFTSDQFNESILKLHPLLITQFTPPECPFLNDLTVQGVCAGGARCAGGAKCDRACGCSAMHSRNSCPRKCAST